MSEEQAVPISDENAMEAISDENAAEAISDETAEETVSDAEPEMTSADIRVVEGGQGSVKPVQFAPLPQSPVASEQNPMDLLYDVALDLSVELGHTSLPVKDVLQLGPGSIVELDKLAGEPVDITVNGKLIARGEVVVVDENFGIRVTEIANKVERLSGLA